MRKKIFFLFFSGRFSFSIWLQKKISIVNIKLTFVKVRLCAYQSHEYPKKMTTDKCPKAEGGGENGVNVIKTFKKRQQQQQQKNWRDLNEEGGGNGVEVEERGEENNNKTWQKKKDS